MKTPNPRRIGLDPGRSENFHQAPKPRRDRPVDFAVGSSHVFRNHRMDNLANAPAAKREYRRVGRNADEMSGATLVAARGSGPVEKLQAASSYFLPFFGFRIGPRLFLYRSRADEPFGVSLYSV